MNTQAVDSNARKTVPETKRYNWENKGAMLFAEARKLTYRMRAEVRRILVDYIDEVEMMGKTLSGPRLKQLLVLAAQEAGWYAAYHPLPSTHRFYQGERDKRTCVRCGTTHPIEHFYAMPTYRQLAARGIGTRIYPGQKRDKGERVEIEDYETYDGKVVRGYTKPVSYVRSKRRVVRRLCANCLKAHPPKRYVQQKSAAKLRIMQHIREELHRIRQALHQKRAQKRKGSITADDTDIINLMLRRERVQAARTVLYKEHWNKKGPFTIKRWEDLIPDTPEFFAKDSTLPAPEEPSTHQGLIDRIMDDIKNK